MQWITSQQKVGYICSALFLQTYPGKFGACACFFGCRVKFYFYPQVVFDIRSHLMQYEKRKNVKVSFKIYCLGL